MGSRNLTAGEINISKTVFGNSINYNLVKIYDEKFFFLQFSDTVISPDGNIYYPPGISVYSNDFSTDTLQKRMNFIHEMTHVMQYQHGANLIGDRQLNESYDYGVINNNFRFEDLTFEQQANFMRDYYLSQQGYTRI